MRTADDGKHRVNTWRDVREFLDGAQTPCKVPDALRHSVARHPELGTIADAVTLARRGWKDGFKTIEALRAKIAEALAGRERGYEAQYDVVGDFFDMGMLLAGEPEHWATMVDNSRRYDTPVARGNQRNAKPQTRASHSSSRCVSCDPLTF